MKRPRSITIFSSLYPFVVLLLVPEIINGVIFSFWFIIELINQSDFGRTMEFHVGLGLIYLIIVYGVLFLVGIVTLIFVIWIIIRAIMISKDLLRLSEKARKSIMFTNLIYATFIICALLLFNYCNFPGRSNIKAHSSANQKNISCKESNNRKIIQTIDLFILPYFAFSAYFFSRRKTKERFKIDNTDGMRFVDCSQPVVTLNKKVQVLRSLIHYLDNSSRNIGKQILGSYPNISGIAKKRLRSLKDKIKTTFRMRTGNKSTTEKFVSAMGWTNLLLILLAIPTKFILLLYFISAGWAEVVRAFIGLFSGRTFPSLTTLNNSEIVFLVLGAAYGLYHIILIFFFLITLKKVTRISTYFWGTISVIILVVFTKMGLNFHWT
jgi:hypothetical protein